MIGMRGLTAVALVTLVVAACAHGDSIPSEASTTATAASGADTSSGRPSWTCSAEEDLAVLVSQDDLPPAVAETRQAIFAAARACDYGTLDSLAVEGSASFQFDLSTSFGSPGELWLALEDRDLRPMANIIYFLNDSFEVRETESGMIYVWPALESAGNPPDRPSVGITEQGAWVFAVFGDPLMPADLLGNGVGG